MGMVLAPTDMMMCGNGDELLEVSALFVFLLSIIAKSRFGLRMFRRRVSTSRVSHPLIRPLSVGRVSDWLLVCFLLILTHSFLRIGLVIIRPVIFCDSIAFHSLRSHSISHARTPLFTRTDHLYCYSIFGTATLLVRLSHLHLFLFGLPS